MNNLKTQSGVPKNMEQTDLFNCGIVFFNKLPFHKSIQTTCFACRPNGNQNLTIQNNEVTNKVFRDKKE